jgi:hypothetical protein
MPIDEKMKQGSTTEAIERVEKIVSYAPSYGIHPEGCLELMSTKNNAKKLSQIHT